MDFLRTYWIAILLSLSFVGSVVAAFSSTGVLFVFALLASIGALIYAIYMWREPTASKPYEKSFYDEDWFPNSGENSVDAHIFIPALFHKKGKYPSIEFLPTEGGAFAPSLPWKAEPNGDIIIRPLQNASRRPFGSFKVRIKRG